MNERQDEILFFFHMHIDKRHTLIALIQRKENRNVPILILSIIKYFQCLLRIPRQDDINTTSFVVL